jgi:cardiolipin synthase
MTSPEPVPVEPFVDAGLWTIPNLVSVVRLACIPLFVWLLLGRDDRLAAAWVLGGLGATDWVDGWIARRFGQTSTVGKILDPTADRLMFLVAVVALVIDESVPLLFAVLTLAREVVISVAALVLAAMGARRIDVTWWGKTSTFGLMFAFPLFLLGHTATWAADAALVAAWVIGVPSLALHYSAGAGYVPLALRALREGRATPGS